ncbi:MAG: RNA-binding protein [bacterium]|nr:RNA-binding protein [bacterium]
MDKNKLFVGGLPWSITNDTFAELFAQYGEIVEAVVITDRDTGRSKGFGFVTFKNEEDAQKALEMDGQEVQERKIVVNVAKPRENRTGGGGFNRDNSRGDRRSY